MTGVQTCALPICSLRGVCFTSSWCVASGVFLRAFMGNSCVTPWRRAGGSPAATHFLCFAKESKQRKATARPLSLRDSRQSEQEIGKRNQLAALKHVSFLIRFPIRSNGSVLSGRQIKTKEQKARNQSAKSKKPKPKPKTKKTRRPEAITKQGCHSDRAQRRGTSNVHYNPDRRDSSLRSE